MPSENRAPRLEAGAAGFHSLAGYAGRDARCARRRLAIGSGLGIMGIPLALPLASLIFLGAFIPLVGALVSGFLAVIVALLRRA